VACSIHTIFPEMICAFWIPDRPFVLYRTSLDPHPNMVPCEDWTCQTLRLLTHSGFISSG
jgi:hypothetical protein